MHKIVVSALMICFFIIVGMAGGVCAEGKSSVHEIPAADHSGHTHSEAASSDKSNGLSSHSAHEESNLPAGLVSTISLIIVGFASLLFTVKIRRRGFSLSSMSGMMAAMSIGMMSSLLIGTIAGVMMTEMFVPTVIAVISGMAVGYFSGQPHGLLASMDGMLAGVMGGMMGAMLGVMVAGDHPVLTVVFMDLVFIMLLLPLNALLKNKEQSRVEKALDEAL